MGHLLRQENEEVHLIIIDAHTSYRPPLSEQITDKHCQKYFNVPPAASCKTPDAMNFRECMMKELKYNLVLYTNYPVTRRYEGRVLFVKASEEIDQSGDLSNGFGKLMPKIRVVLANGPHITLLGTEQSVKQIAHAIEEFV